MTVVTPAHSRRLGVRAIPSCRGRSAADPHRRPWLPPCPTPAASDPTVPGGLTPDAIRSVVAGIRQRTAQPFAVNLWVSTEDLGAAAVTAAEFATALGSLPALRELGVEPPGPRLVPSPASDSRRFIDLRVPVISFVFGVPDHALVEACRRGIVTMARRSTADEALALEAGGLDLVVASGQPAGIGPRFCGRLKRARAHSPSCGGGRCRPIADGGGRWHRRWRTIAAALALGATTEGQLARRSWRATSPMPRPGIAPHCLVRVGTTLC